MNISKRLVAMLLRVYPADWRREYGPELTDMLLARPLTAGTIGDVLWNGVRQRARAAEPSTVCAVAILLIVALQFLAQDVLRLAPGGHPFDLLLRTSNMTLPQIVITPLSADWGVTLLIAAGYWTHLRHGGRISSSGLAAVRVAILVSLPVIAIGVLLLPDLLSAIVMSVFLRLPWAFMWGAQGGLIGRWTASARQRKTATS